MTKQILAIEITGRRWFRRTYGNTYNSFACRVRFADGTEWAASGEKQYGYGSVYEQRAMETMIAAGIIPANYPLWKLRDCDGVFISNNVADVARERDL